MSAQLFFGAIFIIIGAILFFTGKNQKQKTIALKLARSATVADLKHMAQEVAKEIGGGSWSDYVKLSGTIRCDRPLQSALKAENCIYYLSTVERKYEETVIEKDSDGKTRSEIKQSSETVSRQKQSVPFWLVDETGELEVEPDDANIDSVKVLDEFRPEQANQSRLEFGLFSMSVDPKNSADRRTLGYQYTERILPLDRRVLVVGMVSDRDNRLRLSKPVESDRPFVISLKSHEDLAKASQQAAKTMQYAMYGFLGLGVVLVLWHLVG